MEQAERKAAVWKQIDRHYQRRTIRSATLAVTSIVLIITAIVHFPREQTVMAPFSDQLSELAHTEGQIRIADERVSDRLNRINERINLLTSELYRNPRNPLLIEKFTTLIELKQTVIKRAVSEAS